MDIWLEAPCRTRIRATTRTRTRGRAIARTRIRCKSKATKRIPSKYQETSSDYQVSSKRLPSTPAKPREPESTSALGHCVCECVCVCEGVKKCKTWCVFVISWWPTWSKQVRKTSNVQKPSVFNIFMLKIQKSSELKCAKHGVFWAFRFKNE